MLTRSHRFHGYGSLRKTYSHGKTIRGSLVSLRYSDRPQGKPYRVAVVVSRKVNKSAVVRNRIRRRLYETIRNYDNIPANKDLIFTVFSDKIALLEADKLKAAIGGLLNKLDTN